MNSPLEFIIQPKNNRYNNTKSVEGSELVLNTSMQDHNFVSREAIVKAVPIGYDTDIKPGDELIVHHNIFRRFYDVRGEEKNSKSFFKEETYFCGQDQIFLRKKNNEWIAMEGFCFVQPIVNDAEINFSADHEAPLKGIVKYVDESNTVDKEDLIGFTPDSEYEFRIDGKKLYRVTLKSIAIKYEREGNEVEYNPSGV